MKNLYLTFLCLISAMLTVACDKSQSDLDVDENENFFKYKNITYPIDKVCFASCEKGGYIVTDVYFMTSGINVGEGFEGTGDILAIFGMARTEGSIHDGLSEGIYSFNLPESEIYKNFSFNGGSIFTNLDSGVSYETTQEGEISVERNAQEHEIEINMKVDGDYVTGYYKGLLIEISDE